MLTWIHNTLTIKASIQQQRAILNAISNDQAYLDFNKIVPLPDELNIEYCALGEIGFAALTNRADLLQAHLMSLGVFSGAGALPSYQLRDMQDYVKAHLPNAIALGEKYVNNTKTYGAMTWYDWCLQHWGVKWNASQSTISADENQLTIQFTTPWTDPQPILEALSLQFPDLTFECKSIPRIDVPFAGKVPTSSLVADSFQKVYVDGVSVDTSTYTKLYVSGKCLECDS